MEDHPTVVSAIPEHKERIQIDAISCDGPEDSHAIVAPSESLVPVQLDVSAPSPSDTGRRLFKYDERKDGRRCGGENYESPRSAGKRIRRTHFVRHPCLICRLG